MFIVRNRRLVLLLLESQGERKDDAEDPDVSDESTDEADLSAEIDDSPLPIKISNAYTLSQYEGPETDSLTDNIVQCMPFRESKDTDVKDSDSQKGLLTLSFF